MVKENGLCEEITAKLYNGWVCGLVSTLTLGIVRIQLMSPGEFEPGWRKCIETPTLEKSITAAEIFTQNITWQEYGRKVLNGKN